MENLRLEQWEYLVKSRPIKVDDRHITAEQEQDWLNQLGLAGWRLISVRLHRSEDIRYIFERRKK
jgi:hypothetical protein